MLVYPRLTEALVRAGVTRFVVKLFGVDAATHDAVTREEGSFEQALGGIAEARKQGAEVTLTFPLLAAMDLQARTAATEAASTLARTLTERDVVQFPEEQVLAHGGEFHYDLIELRESVSTPLWTENWFPMVHVNTGPVCNIRCTYCNVRGGDDQRVYDPAYVKRLIDISAEQVVRRRRGLGIPTIDFIGGEPTLHPALPELIAYARAQSFEQVSICTNGLLLLRPGYLDSLVSAGLTGVRFSFHDHRDDVSSALADVGDLGSRYADVGRFLLSRRDLELHVYRILLSNTVDALQDYVQWIGDHAVDPSRVELTFGMPSMRGRLFDNPHLYPPLAGLREKLSAAVKLTQRLGMAAMLHHVPACAAPEHLELVSCLHVTTQTVEALRDEVREVSFEGDARYAETCARCPSRERGCHGLPSAYLEANGAEAEAWLVPVGG
jgi:molybdenum cofactor biosynthesis enzyme MoaA